MPRVPKKNPYTGVHLDLLPDERDKTPSDPAGRAAWRAAADATSPGARHSPIFVPLDELTDEQISALPRIAFTQEEWDSLDDKWQNEIHYNDPESSELVERFVDEFEKRAKWASEGEHVDYSYVEDQFEYWLRDVDDLIAHARNYRWLDRKIDATISEWAQEGYTEDQVEDAIREALQDTNNYKFEYNTAEYGSAFFKDSVREGFYIDSTDVNDLINLGSRAMTRDEIERALVQIRKTTYLNFGLDDVANEEKKGMFSGKTVEVDDYADFWVDAEPDWDKVDAAVKSTLEDVDPDSDGVEIGDYVDREQRVLYRFPDNFYVKDLIRSELRPEGLAMGHCVGRPDMGYEGALARGEIKILSLRRPAGKPLFTFEVELDDDGEPSGFKQIKGKANRQPGFDFSDVEYRHGEETRTFTIPDPEKRIKRDEVEKLLTFLVEFPAFQNIALEDVADLRPALESIRRGYLAGKDPWFKKMKELVDPDGEMIDWTVDKMMRHVRQNPAGRRNPAPPACSAHGPAAPRCAGFCVPYRRSPR